MWLLLGDVLHIFCSQLFVLLLDDEVADGGQVVEGGQEPQYEDVVVYSQVLQGGVRAQRGQYLDQYHFEQLDKLP